MGSAIYPDWSRATNSVFSVIPSVLSPLHAHYREVERLQKKKEYLAKSLQAHVALSRNLVVPEEEVEDASFERIEKMDKVVEVLRALAEKPLLPATVSQDRAMGYYNLLSQQLEAQDRDFESFRQSQQEPQGVWKHWFQEFAPQYQNTPSLQPLEQIYSKITPKAVMDRLRSQAAAQVEAEYKKPLVKREYKRDGLAFTEVGKNKTSVAHVRVQEGSGQILVNGVPYDQYFPRIIDRMVLLKPLFVAKAVGRIDIKVDTQGGGVSGQAKAISHGVAKALIGFFNTYKLPGPTALRRAQLLARDPRTVERKKPGQAKARKKFAWVKR